MTGLVLVVSSVNDCTPWGMTEAEASAMADKAAADLSRATGRPVSRGPLLRER